VSQWPAFLSFREALARLRLAFPGEADSQPPMTLPAPTGQLSVFGLAAFAPRTGAPLIANISFNLEPGTVLGVIGPTGAGKSTLVRSIAGLWPHVRGEVRIDGATLDQWDPEVLGRHIGYLPQDIALFDGPVAENISRFYPDATSEAVIKAAKLADVHDLILKLPEGYRTLIGEEGASLSAGQRQRLALARALYGDPVLVIMDEPNSNLDNVGEAALVNAIKVMKANGTTVIVVAHRPSAIAAADVVLLIIEGQQVAFGPRDEVLKNYLRPVPKIQPGAAPVLIQEAETNG
ncbi:MAG: ATP-binding cassette domain-containing protein, partial [Hyphomicrobiales bacterium]|nr:ATP-binding cassette domain-containing protein [Hyphomicrobiales bacterium]